MNGHVRRTGSRAQDARVTVRAALEGHPFDLDALVRHFPAGDPCIVVTEEGTFLETSALDDVFNDGGRLVSIANEQLARLNGYAVLADVSYQRVRLRNKFVRTGGPTQVHLLVQEEAQARDSITVVIGTVEARLGALAATATVPTEPGPSAGRRHVAGAASNKDVDDLLAVAGKAETLSWVDLYKILEIVREAVGGGRAGLIETGWTTKVQLNAFTGSADHHLVSGIHEARHARQSGGPPKRTMTLDEARRFICDLAHRWLDSLP